MQLATVFNQFWRIRLDLDLSDSEIALFFAILSEINRARGKDNNLLESEVHIGNPKLETLVGLSTRQILRLRNRLQQKGLIEFKSGKGKGSYAQYRLGKLFRNYDTDVQVNVQENSNLDTDDVVNVQVYVQDNVQVNDQVNVQRNKNKEYREESIDINNIETTNVVSATPVADDPPKWYLNLDERKKDIVDTWRTIIGPFDPKWLPLISEALRECYPAQIKNAIVTLAKTKADVMAEQGFEYVMEPLLRGAFGRRSKKKKKQTSAGFASKLSGLKQFLEEGENSA
jgi:hypothetical protein